MATSVANSNKKYGVSPNSHDPHATQEFSSQSVWGKLVNDDMEIELKEHRITIGRDEKCTIQVAIDSISKHHCTIKYWKANGVVTVEDTSTNGTWIDGRRYKKETVMIATNNEIVLMHANKREGRAKVSYVFKTPEKDFERESFLNKYTIHRSLGEGAFGEVKLVKRTVCDSENTEETEYAMKKIDKKQWSRLKQVTNRPISISDEVKIMERVRSHENIVSVIESCETKDAMYIVMDYCNGGDMLNYIQKHGRYSNEHARNLFEQLTNAISHMHNSDIAHRDLKPDNILLCGQNSEKLKISDFGISRESTQSMNCKSRVGTPLYEAPEVQLKCKNHEGYDGKLSDIWSLGVILYVMLVAAPPSNDGEEIAKLAKKHNLLWYGEPVVETAKDLIYKMLNVEPKNRLTAKQVLEHPWMLGWDTFEEYKSGAKKPTSDKDKDKQNWDKKDERNGNNSNFDFDKNEDKGVDEDSDVDDDQDDTKNCSNGSENSNGNSHSSYTNQNKYKQLRLASGTDTTIQKSSQQLKSSQLSDEDDVVCKNNGNNDSEDEDDDLKFFQFSNSNPKPNKSLKRKCRSPVASCYIDDVDMNNNHNHNHNNHNNNNNDDTNNTNNCSQNEICDDVVDEPATKRRKLTAAPWTL